jgi:hypothetical protein
VCQNENNPATGRDGGAGGFPAAPSRVPLAVSKPAGPSSRAKCNGSHYPQCGQAMTAGVELGEAIYGRPRGGLGAHEKPRWDSASRGARERARVVAGGPAQKNGYSRTPLRQAFCNLAVSLAWAGR